MFSFRASEERPRAAHHAI